MKRRICGCHLTWEILWLCSGISFSSVGLVTQEFTRTNELLKKKPWRHAQLWWCTMIKISLTFYTNEPFARLHSQVNDNTLRSLKTQDSSCLFNPSLSEPCNSQPYFPWISHVINFCHLSWYIVFILSYICALPCPAPQYFMCVLILICWKQQD